MAEPSSFAALRGDDSDALLSMVLGALHDGVVLCDERGRITFVNKAAEKLLGFQKEGSAGLGIADVYMTLYEEGRVPCENACLKVLKSHRPMQTKRLLICIGCDGRERLVLESAAPLFDDPLRPQPGGGASGASYGATKKFSGAILIIREVTDIIDEIRVPHKMESFRTLAGGMANDFNNLLTVINNSLFMARLDLKPDSEKYQILLNAENAAVQTGTLTNQLLSLAGGGRPVMTDVDMRKIITDAAGFAVTDPAIEYRIECDDDLALVSADRGMIDQAIGHVLKNAVQALPEGGEITVRAKNVNVDSSMPLPLVDGEYICVSIRDNGKGIPQENRSRVFDPFFTTRTDGQGLGLPLAYAAVRQHGGHVTVASASDGTTVSIYLPSLKRKSADEPKKGSGRGQILFMDDEELVRKSARRILEYIGFDVISVDNGDAAVAAYKKAFDAGRPFDIVLLDLIIEKGRGGKDVIKDLLAIDKEACVLISTGYVNDPIVTDYRKFGFSGIVTKPYNIAELNAMLSELSRKKSPTP
jgi:PAS domain S-box-containing protein